MSDTKASRYRILLIGGSLRARSTNTASLRTAELLAPPNVECVMYTGLGDLPHFNVELDDSEILPTSVAVLRAALDGADGVLFSFPEYAGSLPGSFKNLLDWTVGGGMYQKPVAYINTSPPGAAQGAQQTFRTVTNFIGAKVIEDACSQVLVRHDAVDESGIINDPEIRSRIHGVLARMVKYLEARTPSEIIA